MRLIPSPSSMIPVRSVGSAKTKPACIQLIAEKESFIVVTLVVVIILLDSDRQPERRARFMTALFRPNIYAFHS